MELKKTDALQVASMHVKLVQDIVTRIQDVIQLVLENATLPFIQVMYAAEESSIPSTLQINAVTIDPTFVTMQ